LGEHSFRLAIKAMKNPKIPESEMNLLREVVTKRKPDLLAFVGSIGVTPLTNDQRQSLREALAAELRHSGLGENDEPNRLGLRLESLIDYLGHV
jgi:hypothetical protein